MAHAGTCYTFRAEFYVRTRTPAFGVECEAWSTHRPPRISGVRRVVSLTGQ
ncbi:MAG: hypothetical protein ABIL25_10080 [candidate division WOR-3 bacterium]